MNTETDITDILKNIKTPALVLHRTEDIDVHVEEGKYISNLIPNSEFIELQGKDHCFWVGDSNSVLIEIEEFITGNKPLNIIKQQTKRKTKYSKIDIEKTMLNNFQYNLKLEVFAKLCGRSLSVFKRDFKNQFNTTPYRWLKTKRLEYATLLLHENDLNINQVCYESGFKNNSHFIKVFKEKYNTSPNKYRKRALKL